MIFVQLPLANGESNVGVIIDGGNPIYLGNGSIYVCARADLDSQRQLPPVNIYILLQKLGSLQENYRCV